MLKAVAAFARKNQACKNFIEIRSDLKFLLYDV